MSKHTPGPWTYSENAYGAVFVHGGETLTSSVGTEYKELVAGGNNHNTLTIANARLIAAAPDLLAALKQIVFDWDGEPEDMIEASAAIAKAEGGAA